jgi:hypothetical protein
MRLELGTFPVRDIAFGNRTRWADGVLEVNRDHVLNAVRRDHRVTSADLILARPGESVRITSVRDVLEPRIKVEGLGTVYPGICGRSVETVGSGKTHRLAGMAVLPISSTSTTPSGYASGIFIDMAGPGAETMPYGSLLNLCLLVEVDESLHREDRAEAIQSAGLTVSDMLAATTVGLKPPETETFELTSADPSLPKVVFVTSHNSPQHYADSLTAWGTAIYGLTRQTPPWALHPNELLDGAISCKETWRLVNNPVLLEMYRRHGAEFNLVGCIAIRTRWSSQAEKDVTSKQCAKLARLLGAEGAVVAWDAGGNDFMEVIRTVQACENAGIKTVFMTFEEPTDSGGAPMLEPLAEAEAIVSIGIGTGLRSEKGSELPPVETVIGSPVLSADPNTQGGTIPADGPIESNRWVDYYGFGRRSGITY